MNFRGGFPFPHSDEFCWMPATPEKPPIFTVSNHPVLENPQANQLGLENWAQTAPNYNSLAQIFDTNSHVGRIPGEMDCVAGSFQQQSLPSEGWNNIPLMELLLQGDFNSVPSTSNNTMSRDLRIASERPLMSNLQPQMNIGSGSSFRPEFSSAHCQVEQSWYMSNSASHLLQQENQSFASVPFDNCNNSPQISLQYNLPTPSKPSYDLNVSPTLNANHCTPVTPNLGLSLEKQQSAMSRSIMDENTRHEKDMPGCSVQSGEDGAIQPNFSQLLQNIMDSSSTLVSTPLKETRESDKKSELAIDLNETPQQKTPKRRKHRPKVVIEGKRKRTPKPKAPKDTEANENPPAKRKYVRKKILQNSKAQEVEVTSEAADSRATTAQKTCKRVLNFDLEEIPDETRSNVVASQEWPNRSEHDPNIIIDLRATEPSIASSGTRIMPSVQNGNGVFIDQVPNGCVSLQDRQTAVGPLASANDMQITNFHLMGRPVIFKNVDQQQQHSPAKGICQDVVRGKGDLVNLDKVDRPELEKVKKLMQNAFQPIPKTPSKSSEARGSKRDHSQTIQHANLSATNHVTSFPSDKACNVDQLQRNGPILHKGPQHDKRTKVSNVYRPAQNMQLNVKVPESGLQKVETRTPLDVNLIAQKILPTLHSHTARTGSTSVHDPVVPSLTLNLTGQGQTQMIQASNISLPEKNRKKGTPQPNPALAGVIKAQEQVPKKRGPKKKNALPITIDEIIYRLQILNLDGSSNGVQDKNHNALVLYNGVGTLVPYQGVDLIKKRKPRPKVDLDSETNRIWNLLMGKEGSEDMEGSDSKKEKWWEEERNVFRGRVDSFIARMHLVQGDRRFSRWKGSVVDSVIGVFLTQNVSDHLSSSAFMSMAARFPLKPKTQEEVKETITDTDVPIPVINLDDTIKWYEVSSVPANIQNNTPNELVQHQWRNGITRTNRNSAEGLNLSSEEEFILSQDSFDSTITQVAGGIRSCSGSNSETEDPSTGLKHRNGQVFGLTDNLWTEKSSSDQEVCSQENGYTVLNGKAKYGLIESSQPGSGTLNHLAYLSSTVPSKPNHPCLQSAEPYGNNLLTTSKISELWLREMFGEESTSSLQSPAPRSAKGPEALSMSSRTGEVAGSLGNSSKEHCGLWRSQETSLTNPSAFLGIDFTNQSGIPVAESNIGYGRSTCINHQQEGNNMFQMMESTSVKPGKHAESFSRMQNATVPSVNILAEKLPDVGDCSSAVNTQINSENKLVEANLKEQISPSNRGKTKNPKTRKDPGSEKKNVVDWDNLRKKVEINGRKKERSKDSMDSLDYEAVRTADVSKISDCIKERGMNNMLAERMKDFLNRVVKDHGSIDLEWLRDVPPDEAKDYLLSVRGLGLKSVECVRLLTLHHLAFPVDTNVGRIAVRLGWVPLQPLPESLQLHLLELYPILESIQKYLWPRLCKLDQLTLYELHYQMITFGKVFCTKSKPNCNACPMRGECRHFASAFASARLALPGPEERSIVSSTIPQTTADNHPGVVIHPLSLPPPEHGSVVEVGFNSRRCEPIIEEPATPEQECIEISESDIEDFEDPNEIPTIKLNISEFKENLQNYMQNNMELQEADMSKALVALNPDIASLPIPKLKNISRLRTEHQVYELPDSHPLLERLDQREPDDPSPYLLAIWTPGETASSIQPPEKSCGSEPDKLCSDATCFSCNNVRETNSQTVRGTILIPCRTAMRGSFPLNGTYFQVNEMFADHESSLNPINVPRGWIWNLPRRTVYFGTSVSTIFKGLTTPGIQYCFWKGFVCVRGFDVATRAPRPLMARLHFPASKLTKSKNDEKK